MHYIHIGNLIKEELEKQERTISWFAANYIATGVMYTIFFVASLSIRNYC